jgi:hypothetical protein
MALQVALSVAESATQLGDALSGSLKVMERVPGENPREIANLKYTGRVYLYHQDFFAHRNIADIEETFKNHGIDIVLRGQDYLTTAWLEWKRKSTESVGTASGPSGEVLHTIDFTYLPASPLDRGWLKAYMPDGVADFKTDPNIPDSLWIDVKNGVFAMDHAIPYKAIASDKLTFTIQWMNSTLNFARLQVSSKDGSERRAVWIEYLPGDWRAVATPGSVPYDATTELPEQTVYMPVRALDHGELRFEIDFADTVRLALGNRGWVYKELLKVRLRGTMVISPLVFTRHR